MAMRRGIVQRLVPGTGLGLLLALGCSDPDLELGRDGSAGGAGGSAGTGGAAAGGAASGGAGAAPSVLNGPLSVAAGSDHVCALRDGRVWCWGSDLDGQTGRSPANDGTFDLELRPLAGLEQIVEIASSNSHSCARHADGRVSCWGSNHEGQVGPASAPEMTCFSVVLDVGPQDRPCQPAPTLVPGIEGAVELALADGKSCARHEDGSVSCWGRADDVSGWLASREQVDRIALGQGAACALAGGQLSCSNGAAPLNGNVERVVLSASSQLGCAVHDGGSVTCWGPNAHGERGTGAADGSTLPPPSAIGSGATELALGEAHACALLGDGSVSCWGRNYAGGVGVSPQATPECTPGVHCLRAPRTVSGLPRATAISVAHERSCAVTEDDTLWCWGAQTATSRYGGEPVHFPGPWEDGPAVCADVKRGLVSGLNGIDSGLFGPCSTAHDCAEVPLDLSCSHGCGSGPVTLQHAAAIRSELARLEADVCSDQCPAPAAQCDPAPTGELACDQGTCVRFDAAARGCSDPCDCRVESATWNDSFGCAGTDLYIYEAVPCVGCGGSKVTLLIANRGRTRFEGSVTVTVSPTGESPPALPAGLTRDLVIEPGTMARDLVLDVPAGPGSAYVTLQVPGDCDPGNNTDHVLTLPEVATCP